MPRTDISDKLVHFTSGATQEVAFGNLCNILQDQAIRGGDGMIRGGYRCVCFSEAPLASLPGRLVNRDAFSRYSPFGVLFEKRWIHAQGGRPVIYQPEVEFIDLPETHRWRHVRYEPEIPVDFTWEREWRLRVDALHIEPTTAVLVLPSRMWADRIRAAFDERQDWLVAEYAQVMDRDLAEYLREEFGWRIYVLE